MIIVHHLNNSRSQRVLWLMEELHINYEVKRYERDRKTMLAPPALKAIHPLGKSPVIEDNGKVIAETGAIFDYIMDNYSQGRLMPSHGTEEWLRYVYWLNYAEGSAMTPLLLKLVFTRLPQNAPALLRGIVKNISDKANGRLADPQIRTHLDFWDNELSKAEWFAGKDFTAADIM